MVTPSTLFEEFGFNYIGPIDGHDLDALIPTLTNINKLRGPQFLHVITRKGQGYKLAEEDPITYHGPGRFDPAEGIKKAGAGGKPSYSQVFGDWLCDMARQDERLVAITPAMREGSGMVRFSEEFPDALLRRRDRRAARGDLRRRHRLRGAQARGGDLLDLPAARLRPADPRRRDPEPAGAVRAGPRRHRRRRRPDAQRRVRLRLPAHGAEPGRDGARRRERVPADAVHRVPDRWAGGGPVSARHGPGCCLAEGVFLHSRSAKAKSKTRTARRSPSSRSARW